MTNLACHGFTELYSKFQFIVVQHTALIRLLNVITGTFITE